MSDLVISAGVPLIVGGVPTVSTGCCCFTPSTCVCGNCSTDTTPTLIKVIVPSGAFAGTYFVPQLGDASCCNYHLDLDDVCGSGAGFVEVHYLSSQVALQFNDVLATDYGQWQEIISAAYDCSVDRTLTWLSGVGCGSSTQPSASIEPQ